MLLSLAVYIHIYSFKFFVKICLMRVASWEAKISFTARNFPSVCLEERPLALYGCDLSIQLKIGIKKIQWWGQAHAGLGNVSCLCTKIFLLEQWTIHHSDLFSCLKTFSWKATRLDYFMHIASLLVMETVYGKQK